MQKRCINKLCFINCAIFKLHSWPAIRKEKASNFNQICVTYLISLAFP